MPTCPVFAGLVTFRMCTIKKDSVFNVHNTVISYASDGKYM